MLVVGFGLQEQNCSGVEMSGLGRWCRWIGRPVIAGCIAVSVERIVGSADAALPALGCTAVSGHSDRCVAVHWPVPVLALAAPGRLVVLAGWLGAAAGPGELLVLALAVLELALVPLLGPGGPALALALGCVLGDVLARLGLAPAAAAPVLAGRSGFGPELELAAELAVELVLAPATALVLALLLPWPVLGALERVPGVARPVVVPVLAGSLAEHLAVPEHVLGLGLGLGFGLEHLNGLALGSVPGVGLVPGLGELALADLALAFELGPPPAPGLNVPAPLGQHR